MYKGNSLARIQNVKTEKELDDSRDEIVGQADGVLAEVGEAS